MTTGQTDSFGSKGTLSVGGRELTIFRLSAVEGAERLPFSLKVLLENLLRTEDGANITADAHPGARGMGSGGDPEPGDPVHPGAGDHAGLHRCARASSTSPRCARRCATSAATRPRSTRWRRPSWSSTTASSPTSSAPADSFQRNVELEYERNRERYQFLRWGQGAFDNFKVVPPGTGIVHQVNIEHLARVVFVDERAASRIPTRSSAPTATPRWSTVSACSAGASAASRPRPPCSASRCSMLIPKVVGFKLTGESPAGTTATDLVLTVTEMLRRKGVVGSFVEFYGEGVGAVPLANRATIGNMSPEYGSTCAIFPIDEETLSYLRFTGRSDEQVALVEAYAKEQGLWHDPSREARYSETLELDLSTIEPSLAGPKRPQDRVPLASAKAGFRTVVRDYADHARPRA